MEASGGSPIAAQRRRASRSRSSITGRTSGGEASAATASAAASVETGAGAWRAFSSAATLGRGERVADARAGEPEGLRERPQHDHAVVEQRDRSLAAVLEVRLVADERARVGQRAELTVGAVRPAGEREDGIVVADLGARELRGDAVERVGRRRGDRDPVARARRSSARRGGSGRRRRCRARRSPGRRRCSRRSRCRSST